MRRKNKARSKFAHISIIAGAIFVSCLLLLGIMSLLLRTKPIEKLDLSIASYKGIHSILVYVAQHEGLFEKEAVNVTILEEVSGKSALNTFLEGNADLFTGSEYLFAFNIANDAELHLLASIDRYWTTDLIVNTTRNISAPKDLVGKRIGVSKNTNSDFILSWFLQNNQIPLATVQTVNLSQPEIVAGMIDGSLDAAVSWDKYAQEIVSNSEFEATTWHLQEEFPSYFLLMSSRDRVSQKEEAIVRALRAMKAAGELIVEKPKLLQKYAEILGVSESDLSGMSLEHEFALELTQSLLTQIDYKLEWIRENDLGVTQDEERYLHLIRSDILKQVDTELVQIVE